MQRLLLAFALLSLGMAYAHEAPPAPPAITLKPGEYLWTLELAPQGPVVIVISLPEQLAYVYRNGIRIGISTVSTGKPGYETPTGVFTILQKHREHYSNLYDNAPMPFMQRLTWDGVALHAGKVPGYPASHGCVRLPYKFAEKLFSMTSHGMTVVVANQTSHPPTVAFPGLFAPVDPATGTETAPMPAFTDGEFRWTPERAPVGPITIVLSVHDREVVVLRNSEEIGHAKVTIEGQPLRGTHAYVQLEGSGEGRSTLFPERAASRWLVVPVPNPRHPPEGDLRQAIASGQIRIPEAFARHVYDSLSPGATVVVTDEPIRRLDTNSDLTVLRADETAVTPAPEPEAPPH